MTVTVTLPMLARAVAIASLMGSVVAGVILLIKALAGNKFSSRWHHLVWLLLIIRLIMPLTPASPVSVFNLFTPLIERFDGGRPSRLEMMPALENGTPSELISQVPSLHSGESVRLQSAISTSEEGYGRQLSLAQPNIWLTLGQLWLIVAVGLATVFFVTNILYHQKTKGFKECRDNDTLAILEGCKNRLGYEGDIRVLYNTRIATPLVFGLLHPKLIITESIFTQLTEQEKKYVLMHEVAHLKRKDPLINWLILGLQVLHWFNPVVWYAFSKMRQDAEAACDGYVLSSIQPYEYRQYGHTIIRLASMLSGPCWVPGIVGLANKKGHLQRRVSKIRIYKEDVYRLSALALISLVLLVGVLLTNTGHISFGRENIALVAEWQQSVGAVFEGGGYSTTYENDVWHLVRTTATGEQSLLGSIGESAPTAIQASKDGAVVAVVSVGQVQIWADGVRHAANEHIILDSDAWIQSQGQLLVSEQGNYIAISIYDDNQKHIWMYSNRAKLCYRTTLSTRAVVALDDAGHLAAATTEGLSVWDNRGDEVLTQQYQSSIPYDIRFFVEDQRLILLAEQLRVVNLIEIDLNTQAAGITAVVTLADLTQHAGGHVQFEGGLITPEQQVLIKYFTFSSSWWSRLTLNLTLLNDSGEILWEVATEEYYNNNENRAVHLSMAPNGKYFIALMDQVRSIPRTQEPRGSFIWVIDRKGQQLAYKNVSGDAKDGVKLLVKTQNFMPTISNQGDLFAWNYYRLR